MSMPHPRVLMIPFGAVIFVSKAGNHFRVDIHTSKTNIEKLHPALVGLSSVIVDNDDLPPSRLYTSTGPPAVIAKKTIDVHKTHKAFMVEKSKKKALKTLVPVADFEKPMKAGWFYWLEPA